jgi:GMP reductase
MKKTYSFNDVHIVPRSSELDSRAQPILEVSYVTKHSKRTFNGMPLIVSNMDYIGTYKMASALAPYKIWVALNKFQNIVTYNYTYNNVFFTLGMNDKDKTKFDILKARQSPICLDVANGYIYKFLDYVKWVRDQCPSSIIMAGNVCTPEGVENLIKAGADIVKAGIGGGSFCLTRNKTGVGIPQFTVAQECGWAANEMGALCCSDGGVREIGDIAKALGSGSHLVMAGSLFAGYDENEVEWQEDPISGKIMPFYGMSSAMANKKYFDGLKDYRTSEGREDYIKSKGPISALVQDIRGGLASCCTYTNTKHIENLKKNCTFYN